MAELVTIQFRAKTMRTLLSVAMMLVWLLECGQAFAGARQIIVAKDGTGQFRTISEALLSVADATKDSPVDIRIKPGIYDETLTTRDWVNLIGDSREACIIRYDGGPDAKTTYQKHTLWATSTTVLRNLTIVGKRVKYCIHSDGGRAFELRLENCVLQREYPEGFSRQFVAAFGIGLKGGQHILMKDCQVKAELPILFHNWYQQLAACSMTLEKCVLKGGETALEVCCLGSRQRDFFVLHDCVLEGEKSAIKYVNQRDVKAAPLWNGQSEIELVGSGNGSLTIDGASIKDDSGKRRSGLELSSQTRAEQKLTARLEERYGTAKGMVQSSQAWKPVPAPGDYSMHAEFSDVGLTIACAPQQDNPKLFGYANGPVGPLVDMPMMLEVRMKCLAPGGAVQLFYCLAPDFWCLDFRPDAVIDSNNPASRIDVDTTTWQTYRLVARAPDDVKLFVDGIPEGMALKKGEHTAKYFQLRIYGHGNKVMLENTLLTGKLPEK